METYQTEEQQVEAIKRFWNENGNALIAGVVIGLGSFAGYGWYTDHKAEQETLVAESYMSNVEKNATNTKVFNQTGEKFVAEHGDSSYASLTLLAMAKAVTEHKDWAQAAKYLTSAAEKAPTEAIKAIALVRLARVQIEQKAYAQALATLAKPMPESFKAAIEEAKGDTYILQDKPDLARSAYQAAIDAGGLTTNPALQLKIDDLAISLN